MTGNKLWSCYEHLLDETESVAELSNAGAVHRPRSLCGSFKPDGDQINFQCYVILESWKWRASTTNERVTIVLHAQEELADRGATLCRSTVSVSYYEPNSASIDWLHTIHFDFGPQQSCHPTFHAQLTDEPVIPPEKDIIELGCDLKFEECKGRCFKNARIPTSDMTLASVLLCLAADHIRQEFFSDFKAKVLEIQKAMPKPRYDEAMRQSLEADLTRLGSSHWFAHMG